MKTLITLMLAFLCLGAKSQNPKFKTTLITEVVYWNNMSDVDEDPLWQKGKFDTVLLEKRIFKSPDYYWQFSSKGATYYTLEEYVVKTPEMIAYYKKQREKQQANFYRVRSERDIARKNEIIKNMG